METRELRSLDFFMGLTFATIGGLMSLGSVQMFRDPMLANVMLVSNPGMTSLVIGLLLVVMGGGLMVIGWSGAKRPVSVGLQGLSRMMKDRSFWKSILVLGLIALYFFVFWGRMPYWLATFLFLCLNMFIFKAGAWWKIVLIAGTATLLIVYFFGTVAKVPLP